jgi:hypothetical protein
MLKRRRLEIRAWLVTRFETLVFDVYNARFDNVLNLLR